MTQFQRQDLTEVESLLATRQQLAEWLEKLEAAGTKAPAAVRDRVRADYQGRLAQVVGQLRGHCDAISANLQGLRDQAKEFGALRSEEQETLAEAELRYAVGEYSPEEWGRVEKDSSVKIGGLNEELGRLAGEIGRLEEVLALVSPPAPSAPPTAAAAPAAASGRREPEIPSARSAPAPASAPVPPAPSIHRDDRAAAKHAESPAEPPEAPRFVPRGGLKVRDSGPAKTIPFPNVAPKEPAPAPSVDELTFLKSVSLEGGRGSASTAAAPAETRPDRPSQSIAKTLKCGECGSLNRPTEWYCERCGAELAAV
jgi:hypothetical protein